MMLNSSRSTSRRILQNLSSSSSSSSTTTSTLLNTNNHSFLIAAAASTPLSSNTVRFYAKKDNREKKVSFKKQQQQRRELLAKQKREQLERKAEAEERKRLEKEAKELARSQAKQGKEGGAAGQQGTIDLARTKPKVIPIAAQIGKKSGFLQSEKIVAPAAPTELVKQGEWLHQFARVKNIAQQQQKQSTDETSAHSSEESLPMFGVAIDGKNAPDSSADFGVFHSWITSAVNITFVDAIEKLIASPSAPQAERVFELKFEIFNALVLFSELHPDAHFYTYAESLLSKFNSTVQSLESNSAFVNAIKPFKSNSSSSGALTIGQAELDRFLAHVSKFTLDSEDSQLHHSDLQASIEGLREYLREYARIRVAKPDTRLYELPTRKELINGQFNSEVDNVVIRKKVPGIEVKPAVAVSRYSSHLGSEVDPTENNSDTLKSLMTHVSNDGQRLYLWKTVRSALLENVDKELAEKTGASAAEESTKETKGKRGKDTNKRDSRFVQLNGLWNQLMTNTSRVVKNSTGGNYYVTKKPVNDLDVIVWLTDLRSNILPLVQREQQLWNPLKRHRLIANPLVRRSIFRFQTKFERGNPDPKRNFDSILTNEVLSNPEGHTASIPELSIQGWDVAHYRKLYADIFAAKYDAESMAPFLNLSSALNACLKSIGQDIFGVQDYKFEECTVSETWNPKYVKKVVLSTDEGNKTLYLDLSPPTQFHFNRQNAVSYPAGPNSAVLRLPFLFAKAENQELPFGITRTLTALELKNLCGEFMNGCLHLFKDQFNGDVMWQSVAKEAAENFALDKAFLSQFEHDHMGMKIPENYIDEVVKRVGLSDPKYGAHEVLSQIIYSIFDYQLFTGASGSSSPMEMFRTLEQKLSVNDNVQMFDLNYFWNIHRQNPITSLLVKSRAQQIGTENLKTFVYEGKSGFDVSGSDATSFEALVARVGKELQ